MLLNWENIITYIRIADNHGWIGTLLHTSDIRRVFPENNIITLKGNYFGTDVSNKNINKSKYVK